ncbi:MAG: transglutaminase domain-containing protein, partial [Candidatus Acidiferrales bacterium]
MRAFLEGALSIRWISYLPGGLRPPKEAGSDRVEMEASNVAAFEKEDSMPPEKVVRPRVQFYYTKDLGETPDQFWTREGKEWNEFAEQFMKKRKAMEQAVAQTVSPGDSPDTKLRKLYARAQQIRNLTFEELKTEKEEKREKLKDNNHVEDVWTRGYGYRTQINRLFVALARAAGMDAAPVRVSERDEYFFIKNLLDWEQLNGEVAHVRVGGQEYYLDPGTVYCPFGLMPSERMGVMGIRLAADGGTFVKTPEPQPEQGLIQRQAVLKLDGEGGLAGTLTVLYHGLEALERRINNLDEDEAGRRKGLEEEVKGSLPEGAEVRLERATGWEGTEEPLRAEFHLQIAGMAAHTGRRMLVPLSVFHATRTHPFEHEKRR